VPGPEDAGLRFDPCNTAPDIHPAVWWNRVRAAAYAGSRHGARAKRGPDAPCRDVSDVLFDEREDGRDGDRQ